MRKPLKVRARLTQPVKTKLVHMRAPVTVTASDEGEKQAAFSASPAYSGGKIGRHTTTPMLPFDFVIDIKGMTAAKNVKANLDHKRNQRVGHATEVTIGDNAVEIAGLISASTEHSDVVAKSASKGYGWEVSIEADLGRLEKLPAGKKAIVNGQEFTGPLLIARKSHLDQVAFVSQGADEGNHVTIAASAAEGAPMLTDFEKFIVKCGHDHEAVSDEVRAELQGLFDLKTGSGGDKNAKTKSFDEIFEEQRRDNARVEAITKMAHDAARTNEGRFYIEQIERSAKDAITNGTSVMEYENHLLRASRSLAGKFSNIHSDEPSENEEVIQAALCLASNLPGADLARETHNKADGPGGYFTQATLEAVDRHKMRGYTIQQYLLHLAGKNGLRVRAGDRITNGNIRTVFTHAFAAPVQASLGGYSAVSAPGILGEVANKQILAGYMEEDNTWKEFARIKNVSNFYTQNHYRLLDSLEYEEIGSGGEIPHGTLGQETYTSQAKTYAKGLGLTRNQIINDDLGAFDDIRERLGRGAAKKFGNVFWTAFMNNSAFFTTALTNYIEGGTTNLGTDGVGLGLAVKAFRKMTSPSADGTKRVGITATPRKLLVPPELEQIADTLYRNQNLGAVANSSANNFAGKYRPIVQNRLSESAFTGNSTTAFYLFGDDMQPMIVTFLNGNQTPIIESADADFSSLGVLFRGYHDFGCDKAEYLAGLKSKGAA